MFIYLITNTINGKVYVGQTIETVHRRWQHHKYAAKGNRKHHLLNALRKYGPDSFMVETLCECPDQDSLNESEKFFIWILSSYKPSFGYNNELGGSNGRPSDASRKKMSDAQKGKHHSDETRRKMSTWQLGRKMSEESKQKMSESRKGRKMPPRSEEYRKDVSERQKGKPLSESRKLAISNSLKGKVLSEETRRKISESRKGKPRTQSQVEYYQSRIGSKASDETKAKQSEARKSYWKQKKSHS